MPVEVLSDEDISKILKEAEDEVATEMRNLGVDVEQLELKLHIKLDSAIREDNENCDLDDDVDDYQISEPNTQFPGLSLGFEADENTEEIDLLIDGENERMDIDEEEVVQDASGILEPALGKHLSFYLTK